MAGGRVLAGRYLLSGQARGSGVAALDRRSGAQVQLDAVPLPELVEPFDQVARPAQERADSTTARALGLASFVAETVPDHPRLSQVFQVFDEAGYLWVAGEAVPGATLGRLLERGGPLSPYRAAEIAHDLVSALRAVHAAGLVHGNVTPETVQVCDDGTALLGGLLVGVAQEALCGGPGADRPGAGVPGGPWAPVRIRAREARAVIVGAVPERWSPEQIGLPPADTAPGGGPPAAPAVGPAADAWALGVLLYRAVTGGSPFPGREGEPEQDTESLFAAVRAGRYGRAARPVLPRAAPGERPGPPVDLPECGALGPLVKRLLRPDPAARPTLPQVAEELRLLLLRAPEPVDLDGQLSAGALLPVRRRRVGAVGVAEPSGGPGGGPGGARSGPPGEHHHHAAPGRHPALLGGALVGGIILFVLLALVLVVSVSH